MKNLISIIVPVYNVERHIIKCIESITNQTYTNLEIICINDGSTDDSGKICDDYSKRDNRIKVIHKKNEGVSSARNFGLKHATGEFIGFVDPDDWIENRMYEVMIDALLENNADIAIANYYIDTDETTTPMINQEQIDYKPFNQEKLITYAFKRDEYKGFGAYIWNKLFRASLFKMNDSSTLNFDENITFCEDIIFFTNLALNSKKSIYITKPMYHYYKRNSSLSHTADISKRVGSLHAYKRIIEMLENKHIVTWLKRFYTYHASLILEICVNNNYDDKISIYANETKRYIKEYINTNTEYPERIQRMEKLLQYNVNV